MGSKVHYEDDLFFLHSILRTVEAGLRLDIDAELFRDKVLEDVFFIDATLMRIFSSLKDNPYLISRANYLRSLRRTVVAFSSFVEQFARGDLGYGEAVAAYHDRLETALRAHRQVRKEIDQILDEEDVSEETASLISTEEYSFLLAEDREADESESERVEDGLD
jgi:hypothetical protein